MLVLNNGQCEHPDCPWCARIWFRWYAARMNQMHVPRKNRGETTSFAEAAATSVKPPKE